MHSPRVVVAQHCISLGDFKGIFYRANIYMREREWVWSTKNFNQKINTLANHFFLPAAVVREIAVVSVLPRRSHSFRKKTRMF